VSSRGGLYGPGTPAAPLEHQESYLRAAFGFFGITDITFVRAEGVALGSEAGRRPSRLPGRGHQACRLIATGLGLLLGERKPVVSRPPPPG
jgi:hypothetical protein